jgi:hypothetical protein
MRAMKGIGYKSSAPVVGNTLHIEASKKHSTKNISSFQIVMVVNSLAFNLL